MAGEGGGAWWLWGGDSVSGQCLGLGEEGVGGVSNWKTAHSPCSRLTSSDCARPARCMSCHFHRLLWVAFP